MPEQVPCARRSTSMSRPANPASSKAKIKGSQQCEPFIFPSHRSLPPVTASFADLFFSICLAADGNACGVGGNRRGTMRFF